MTPATLEELRQARATRVEKVLATRLEDGGQICRIGLRLPYSSRRDSARSPAIGPALLKSKACVGFCMSTRRRIGF